MSDFRFGEKQDQKTCLVRKTENKRIKGQVVHGIKSLSQDKQRWDVYTTSVRNAHWVILKTWRTPHNSLFGRTVLKLQDVWHNWNLPGKQWNNIKHSHEFPERPLESNTAPTEKYWHSSTVGLILALRTQRPWEVKWLHSQQVTDSDTAGFRMRLIIHTHPLIPTPRSDFSLWPSAIIIPLKMETPVSRWPHTSCILP